jgi:hypothetical protein
MRFDAAQHDRPISGIGANQVSWEFLLVPLDNAHTRLVVRGRISHRWPGSIQATGVLSAA